MEKFILLKRNLKFLLFLPLAFILVTMASCAVVDNGTPPTDPTTDPDPEQSLPNFGIAENEIISHTIVAGDRIEINITNYGGDIDSCAIAPGLEKMVVNNTKRSCIIQGAGPSKSGTIRYTLIGNNDFGFDSVRLNLVYKNTTVPPDLSSDDTSITFHQNQSIVDYAFNNNGGIVTECSVTPDLPDGVSIVANSDSCVISGNPTVSSALTSYTITGSNQSGSSDVSITITVKDDQTAPVITYPTTGKIYFSGFAISPFILDNTGGTATSCTISPLLPPGFSLSVQSGTCRFSGQPTAASSETSYTVTAANAAGSGTFTLSIRVIDSSAAPNLQWTVNQLLTFNFKTDIKQITLTNNGGKPTACDVTPTLPQGMYVEPSFDSCKIVATRPGEKVSNVYTITGKNAQGSHAVNIPIRVYEDPDNPLAPDIDDGGYFSLTVFSNVALDPVVIANNGGSITSCRLEGAITAVVTSPPPVPTGISVTHSDEGCVISGTPTQITNGSYNVIASNKAGTSTLNIAISVVANSGPPNLGSIGSPPTYYVSKTINDYFFANSGGAAEFCLVGEADGASFVEKELPRGLEVIKRNGTCGITGTPAEISASATYHFLASNQFGNNHAAGGYYPGITIVVKSPDEQTAADLVTPTLQYIQGSHAAFQPNSEIIVEAGKYYGTEVGNYLSVQVFGPYNYQSNADENQVDLNNDNYKNYFVPLSSYNIPLTSWFTPFQVSIPDTGYYRLYAAFCISATTITDTQKCKYGTGAASKVINVGKGGGDGGDGAPPPTPTSEDVIAIVKDLQSKTSEELARLEAGLRSERLQKAIDNLNTRPASQIEGTLKTALDSNPSFSSLQSEFPDVVRVLNIFKDRYDNLHTKLSFPNATSDYDKAQVAWEWLFPMRNGHIIEFPERYNDNVAQGEFPYTFRNFLMATALYPKFCGESVGQGNPSTEAEYTKLCIQSMAESFAHFAQEVGGHIGDPQDSYTAPANGKVITAEKAGAAGGMKIFTCTTGYYDQPNAHGFKLCDTDEEIPEWRQALYWVNENGCSETGSGCEYRECAPSSWQAQTWPCPDGTKYFGRGAKQLSYNYNYGPFSEIIYGTVHTLLQQPSKITEGWLALVSAVSFFMQPRPPKPSMFERIYGFWELPSELASNPKDANLSGEKFSASIMIINGGIECGGSSAVAQAANRVKYFLGFLDFFGVDTSSLDQGSDSMTCANTAAFDTIHGASYDSYFVERNWIGGCFLVSYESPYSGFFPGNYEKCIRNIVVD